MLVTKIVITRRQRKIGTQRMCEKILVKLVQKSKIY